MAAELSELRRHSGPGVPPANPGETREIRPALEQVLGMKFKVLTASQQCVDYGAAYGALAMTTPGDTTMASLDEVEKVMKGGSARVGRWRGDLLRPR